MRVIFIFAILFVATSAQRVVPAASISYGFQSPSGGLQYHRARLMCTHEETERYMFWVRLAGGASIPATTGSEDCEWEMTDLSGRVTTVAAMETVTYRWSSIEPRGLLLRDDVTERTVDLNSPLLPFARVVSFLVQISAAATKSVLTNEDPSIGMRLFSNDVRPLDHVFPRIN